MFRIVESKFIAPEVKRFLVAAPQVAAHWRAGQFVILRVDQSGERIPLTVAAADPDRGTITLFVQGVGKTTRQLNTLEAGDELASVAGPLGKPSDIEHYGTAVVVGGGVGTAIAYPVVAALRHAGNRVVAIVGGRSRDYVLLESEIAATGAELIACTDDGSYGRHGFVTEALADVIADQDVDVVFAAGPVPMMRVVADVTRPAGIHTIASLNPIMVDGTGMCGGCRVAVGGKTMFACVDGPEFDAHLVDFDLLTRRNQAYVDFERNRLQAFDRQCRLETS
jgi:ferredoxin--NADP+ reductase